MYSKILSKQEKYRNISLFPVWLQKRLASGGLELFLRQTEKSCIASYYKQLSMNIKIKNYKINTSFVSQGLWPLEANKTVCNLIIFHVNIHGKLSMIRCDK